MTLSRNSSLCLAVALGCVLGTPASGQEDAPKAASTVDPAPHDWLLRHRALCDRNIQGGVDLVFLGDSITQSWERNGAPVWEHYYGERKAANLGMDGDRTQNVLWRIENSGLAGIDPKVVVLQLGIHNLLVGNSPKDTYEGLLKVVGVLRERLPAAKILVLGLFPVGQRPNPYREKLEKVNAFLAPIAEDDAVEFLDIGAVFLEQNSTISQLVMGDFIHPTEEGYRMWARAMEEKLAAMLGVEPVAEISGVEDPDLDLADDPASMAIQKFIETKDVSLETMQKTRLPRPPMVTFNHAMDYVWKLTTNFGEIEISLWPKTAPMHVSSTMYLTKIGFYDGIIFHRVISNFMAQAGCPLGTGTGGPGYKYRGEFDSKVKHDRPGMLSMANAGPNTDGSQFFLTFVPTPHLDGKHTLFGEIVAGMDTLKELEKRGSRSGRTLEPLTIEKAEILIRPKKK